MEKSEKNSKEFMEKCNQFNFKRYIYFTFIIKKINNLNGILINKLVYISSRVTFKEGVKVHVQSQIHHDVSIGKYVTLAPRCILLAE